MKKKLSNNRKRIAHNMEDDMREEELMVEGRVFLMKGRKDCGEIPEGSANMLPVSLSRNHLHHLDGLHSNILTRVSSAFPTQMKVFGCKYLSLILTIVAANVRGENSSLIILVCVPLLNAFPPENSHLIKGLRPLHVHYVTPPPHTKGDALRGLLHSDPPHWQKRHILANEQQGKYVRLKGDGDGHEWRHSALQWCWCGERSQWPSHTKLQSLQQFMLNLLKSFVKVSS